MKRKPPLTVAEIKRRLIDDSRERARLVALLVKKIREEERAKPEVAP